MSQQTPNQMELKIWISADPDVVWQSWSRPDRLARWFQHTARAFAANHPAESLPQARSGDHYEWTLVHGHRSRGTFLEIDPQRRIVHFTFGGDSGMSTRVQVEPADRGCLVRLEHLALPAGDVETFADVKAGWTFYLTNLKAFHEHGVDLREHTADRIRAGAINI